MTNIFKNKTKKKTTTRIVALFLISVLMISGIFTLTQLRKPTPIAHAAWYNLSGTYWNYRSKITVDHTKVGAGGVTNFPVLVTEANVPAGFWTEVKSDGSDIRVATSDSTTLTNHELVAGFNTTTHKMELWFLAPALSSSAPDTTFYLYWGNPTASALAASWGQGVWSAASDSAVWHSNDTSTTTIADSTSNINTGTKKGAGEPVEATGQLGKAQTYDGSNDYIDCGTNSVLNIGANQAFTIEAWVKTPATGTERIIAGKRNAGNYYLFRVGGAGKLRFLWSDGVAGSMDADSNVSDNTWYHIAITRTGTTFTFYRNGIADGVRTATMGSVANSDHFQIGAYSGGVYPFNGLIDETRVSTVARTAADIATEYANQNSPSTFYSMDAEAAGDIIAPSNPTAITGYSTSGKVTPITTGGFYNYPTPYFEWPAAEAVGGAADTGNTFVSGVAGYYSYFGTSCGVGGADPAITRGTLADTGGGLNYSATTNVTVPDLSTNNGTYCLRIKTKDVVGNVSAVYEAFAAYKYDATAPSTPSYIAANPAGYTATNSFSFSWPAVSDQASTPVSGLAGYQYERGGSSGDSWSATQAGTSVSSITAYQGGENIFLVRAIDNAGNISPTVQTTYYYSANAPTKPTGVTATPTVSDINSFSFNWTAPAHPQAIVDYGYSINAYPTNLNINWTGSNTTSIGPEPFATLQGENTFYIVAKDEGGNYSLDAGSVGSVVFNCQTPAPIIPALIAVNDSSNRAIDLWALTIKWNAGAGQDPATFSHYSIERSTNGVDFSEFATTASTAYVDATVNNTSVYYYRIRAVDNAGAVSAPSSVIARTPTGKYTAPPESVSGPEVTTRAVTATIDWVSSRVSTSGVRFGTDENNLSRSQIDPESATDHSISIVGLTPGTKYYYQTQSLDEYRDYSSDSAYSITYSFTTLAIPSIAKVTVSNITLTAADISFETNAPANFSLDYGTSISYDNAIAEAAGSYTTNHSLKLKNLANTTRYHFKLMGSDIDGNVLSSDDYVFDTLASPRISSISYKSDLSGPVPQMIISWMTNVPTSSSLIYYPVDNSSAPLEQSGSALVVQHSLTISNLLDSTSYKFRVFGTDQFGNTSTSDEQILTTPLDTRPPKITNITIESSNIGLHSTGNAQLSVSWVSDEPATGYVEYGEGLSGSDYSRKTVEDKSYGENHLVIITGLTPSSPYHLRVVSADNAGNVTQSPDNTVVSGVVSKSVLDIILGTLSRIFGWLGGSLLGAK